MSQRADFVIIRENKANAYTDEWGALGCIYMFGDGPDSAVQQTANMEEMTVLDAVFTEAGFLIDFDQKTAIVFGYPSFGEELGEKGAQIDTAISKNELAYLQHITPNWPGWHLIWDYRGVEAFADHLNGRSFTNITVIPSSRTENILPVTLQA